MGHIPHFGDEDDEDDVETATLLSPSHFETDDPQAKFHTPHRGFGSSVSPLVSPASGTLYNKAYRNAVEGSELQGVVVSEKLKEKRRFGHSPSQDCGHVYQSGNSHGHGHDKDNRSSSSPQGHHHGYFNDTMPLVPMTRTEELCSDFKLMSHLAWFASIMFLVEVACGYVSHSLALRADAPHQLADCFVYFINSFAESKKFRNEGGGSRWDLFGCVISLVLLLPTAVFVFIEVYQIMRYDHKREKISEPIVFGFALTETIGNVTLSWRWFKDNGRNVPFYKMFKPACPHSGCKHHGREEDGENPRLNAMSTFMHAISDIVSNVILLISSALMMLEIAPSRMIDAIAAGAVGVCIVIGVFTLLPTLWSALKNVNTFPAI